MKKSDAAYKNLIALLKENSKHSDYQLLHPTLSSVFGENYLPTGKKEIERQFYMQDNLPISGSTVLDIGANTGYFSFGALQAEASHVTAVEGNPDHSKFIEEAAKYLDIEHRLIVKNCYFDFSQSVVSRFDIILCLNVLHHVGDDFGDAGIGIDDAKAEMVRSLRNLASNGRWMWFQLGFNWKGNRNNPLFRHGLKAELIEFVADACQDFWSIEKVAVYDPVTRAYEDVHERLLERYDDIGEFLNRPLFLLRSCKECS